MNLEERFRVCPPLHDFPTMITTTIQKLLLIITRVSHLLPMPILPNDEVDLLPPKDLKVDPDRDLLIGDDLLLLIEDILHEDTPIMITMIRRGEGLIITTVTEGESTLVPKEEENYTRV